VLSFMSLWTTFPGRQLSDQFHCLYAEQKTMMVSYNPCEIAVRSASEDSRRAVAMLRLVAIGGEIVGPAVPTLGYARVRALHIRIRINT